MDKIRKTTSSFVDLSGLLNLDNPVNPVHFFPVFFATLTAKEHSLFTDDIFRIVSWLPPLNFRVASLKAKRA